MLMFGKEHQKKDHYIFGQGGFFDELLVSYLFDNHSGIDFTDDLDCKT